MIKNIAIICACILFIAGCSNEEENIESFENKTEFSALQHVEYKFRNEKISGVVLYEHYKYLFAVIPSQDKDTNIAVMLNAESKPFYKQLPDQRVSYRLTKEEFEKIVLTRKANANVIAEMRNRIL